jgi:hypothetical protein
VIEMSQFAATVVATIAVMFIERLLERLARSVLAVARPAAA